MPASVPFIPLLARTPSAAAVSSKVSLASLANGATNFKDSPKSSMVCADEFAATVKMSTTFVVSFVSKLKPRKTCETISADLASSVLVALDKFKTPLKAF